MRGKISLCLLLALMTASDLAMADNGLYFGAAVTNVDADFTSAISGLPSGTSFGSDSGYKLIIGMRPLDWLAVEANYTDLGTSGTNFDNIACAAIVGNNCPLSASADSTTLSASAIGILALPVVDLYARAGFARWNLDEKYVVATVPGTSATTRGDSGFDPVVGLGGQFKLGSISIRAEFEHYDVGDNSTDIFSVGLTYTLF